MWLPTPTDYLYNVFHFQRLSWLPSVSKFLIFTTLFSELFPCKCFCVLLLPHGFYNESSYSVSDLFSLILPSILCLSILAHILLVFRRHDRYFFLIPKYHLCQGSKNFPNFWRHKDDIRQDAHWGSTNMRNHRIKFGRLVFVHLQTYVSLSAFSFHSVYPDVLPLPSPRHHFANLSACFKGDKMAAACGTHKQEQRCSQSFGA